MRVAVVSFNANEAFAVDTLLNDLASGTPSPWRRDGPRAVERGSDRFSWRLEHFAVRAQGNVVAAARLAAMFANRRTMPDFVVFYGCAGAVEPVGVGEVYLVGRVNYLSLGTVTDAGRGAELVTLKNKWLCHLDPPDDVEPLALASFSLCTGTGPVNVPELTGLPTARVAATDKVTRVAPGTAPPSVVAGPPQDLYRKAEWSYGEALAFVAAGGAPLLVEMESYGIARIAEALDILDRVIVLRVTTDDLVNHGTSEPEQRALLVEGRKVLAHLLVNLYGRA
jgi:hypothetical protein